MRGILAFFTVVGTILAAIGGYIANIVKLIGHEGAVIEWTAMEIARVVGIFFPPLGAILGFC